jgi:hypothetical protein
MPGNLHGHGQLNVDRQYGTAVASADGWGSRAALAETNFAITGAAHADSEADRNAERLRRGEVGPGIPEQ